ncbi:MAG: antibiotic biosynthesis monooxygenase [Saprospiraceae bacterium]|jgi:heme-degrading monooxygenase HmoA|nr:antibiotic biosynthesis monooxygenase [Saprospiraceae bacterium]
MLAATPLPPYYAVIFTSVRTETDAGYAVTAQRMLDLAAEQPGYLGEESARNEIGITVSYWLDLESIRNWKAHTDHQIAQELGKSTWYRSYRVRICKVEREYGL